MLVVPHVADEIQAWVTRVSQMPVALTGVTRNDSVIPDVCVIEVITTTTNIVWVSLCAV